MLSWILLNAFVVLLFPVHVSGLAIHLSNTENMVELVSVGRDRKGCKMSHNEAALTKDIRGD